MPRGLEGFPGDAPIFIDANIFLHHAFDSRPLAVEFLAKIESRSFRAVTSSLVLEEVVFKLVLQSASNYLERVTVQAAKRLLRDAQRRKEVLAPVEEYMHYIQLLSKSGLTVLELTSKDIREALCKSLSYGLMSADAAHLAVMERKKVNHLASDDSDFERVDGITLWSP